MATGNIDSFNLKSIQTNGLIREDVMDKIWDISKIPLPFTDMIGSRTVKNERFDWTQDKLAAPDVTNARIDGQDAGAAGTATGKRVGNHTMISDKVIAVSYRADASDTIGRAKELAYRLTRGQQELRRDVEAISLNNQASVAGTDTVAGRTGGLPSWIETNVDGGTAGGYNTGTGLTVARTVGVGRALSFATVKAMIQGAYTEGGEVDTLMSTPAVIGALSEYMFTSTARIATLQADQGKSSGKATALGSVNVIVTDFGTVKMVDNRLQPTYQDSAGTTTCADVFLLDSTHLSHAYLHGYRTDSLAKTGLSEKRHISVDWGLQCGNEAGLALIGDIDTSAAAVD